MTAFLKLDAILQSGSALRSGLCDIGSLARSLLTKGTKMKTLMLALAAATGLLLCGMDAAQAHGRCGGYGGYYGGWGGGYYAPSYGYGYYPHSYGYYSSYRPYYGGYGSYYGGHGVSVYSPGFGFRYRW